MIVLGLDIGTTTISAVVMDDEKVLTAKTYSNDSFISNRPAWEKAQSPEKIRSIALPLVAELLEAYPDVSRIGLTGQQHGILYLDECGCPLSPLYTWQDGRGDLPYKDGKSYAAFLSEITGYPLATGYGMVTHFYNMKNGLVPENAVTFCTIHDYLAMVLANRTSPQLDPSDAASFGMFDLKQGCFDQAAMKKAGIDIAPVVAETPLLGADNDGRLVYTAIGDNQASFLGATNGQTDCMLINVGTGSQFSVHIPEYAVCEELETRPFPTGGYLLVGSSLCGGRAYALLEQFFRKTADMLGHPKTSCYEAMNRLLDAFEVPEDPVIVHPLFQGTRSNPSLRGRIENLSVNNFDPISLIYGTMQGMSDELHEMYLRYLAIGGKCDVLFGSGNGLRKNQHLCQIFEQTFGLHLTLSQKEEEAACGAAAYARSM